MPRPYNHAFFTQSEHEPKFNCVTVGKRLRALPRQATTSGRPYTRLIILLKLHHHANTIQNLLPLVLFAFLLHQYPA